MRSHGNLAGWMMLGMVVAVGGCKNNGTVAPPASQETLRMVRQQLTEADPTALVGLVIAIEPKGRPYAAVGDLPVKDFEEGEPITFIDSQRRSLCHGVVRRITEDTLHVEWFKAAASSGRAPRVGDLAVRFKSR